MSLEMQILETRAQAFTVLGSRVVDVGGYASGYAVEVPATAHAPARYMLTTSGDEVIGRLVKTGAYLGRTPNGGRFVAYTWAMVLDGVRYVGRNAGAGSFLRMRARARKSSL